MSIQVACKCGRALNLRDELAGKKIRCPQCTGIVAVPKKEVESDEAEFVVTEVVEENVTATRPRPAPASSKSGLASKPSKSDDRPKRKKSRSRSREDDYESRGPWIAVNPQIITGLLMMIGAVVWFVLGLSFGYIYFYPPVLFVFGIAAIVRGFMGSD